MVWRYRSLDGYCGIGNQDIEIKTSFLDNYCEIGNQDIEIKTSYMVWYDRYGVWLKFASIGKMSSNFN